jgi:hypothetical protein
VKKHGKRKAFHVGSNSSCRQHIRSHFEVYEARCKEEGIIVHHHAVPPAMARRNEIHFFLYLTLFLFLLQSKRTGRVSTTTDLWSVNQTKASFMGITAHWIESDAQTSTWALCKEVIAFQVISGPHDGVNLGGYFVGLCKRVGLIGGQSTRVRLFFIIIPIRSNPSIAFLRYC